MIIPGMTKIHQPEISPCMFCHQPNVMLREKLRRIEEKCRKATEDRHGIDVNFLWGIHSHCRYGISCSKLSQYDSECNQIASRIEERIVDAVYSDSRTYHDIYEMCRGDFPAVCRELERIHAKSKKAAED